MENAVSQSQPVSITLPLAVLKALTVLKRAVGKTYVPILENVLVSVSGGRVALTTTDLQLGIRYTADVPDYAGPDFATTLPVKALVDILKSAKTDAVLTVDDSASSASICIDGVRRTLFTLPASEFPPIPAMWDVNGLWAQDDFAHVAQGFTNVAQFCSDEQHRGILMGIYVERNGGLTATDGSKMRHLNLGWSSEEVDPNAGVTVPESLAKAIGAIKLAKGESLTAAFHAGPQYVRIEAGPWQIAARIDDGQYPAYRNVCPTFNEATMPNISIDRKALLGVVKQATASAGDRAYLIVLSVEDGICSITAESEIHGKFSAMLPCEGANMQPTGFNGKFLQTTLNAFKADTLRMISEGPEKPARFYLAAEDAFKNYVLQMPLRLK